MCAKIQIPDALKADVPHNTWGKVLAATPIVMTVIATMLAGLSSSEMTRAQYDRSLAAQQQSKAGDQWSYFQAKRLRASMQRSTLDLLRGTTVVRPLDAAAVSSRLRAGTSTVLNSDAGTRALESISKGVLPVPPADPQPGVAIAHAISAVDEGQTDAEIAKILADIKPEDISTALRNAAATVRAYDAALKPINQAIDTIEKDLAVAPAAPASTGNSEASSAGGEHLARDFSVARLNYAAMRYDAESRQNQVVAQLYELQVRKSNLSAERHHRRSQRFFYGMLAAQMGVIISTFSMAARKQNFLWSLAAAAGTAAVAFAAYVYLYV